VVIGGASSGARRYGYRLFGRGFDYLLHLRPAEWPIVAAHTTLGALLASTAGPLDPGKVILGVVLWVIFLNGGTLAINSAFDRDEGDIAYLRRPPRPPRRLFAFGLGLMVAGLAAAAVVLPSGYVAAYAACLALSVLYSVPPARLKAVAFADWIINMIGFGALTGYAGWAATGNPLTSAGLVALLAFCPLFAALYPLTQLYQADEDHRRGDRTLALRLGMRRSLDVALAGTAVAFGMLGWAGSLAGWGADARWALLGLAAAAWAWVLIPWRRTAATRTPAAHQRGMYLALGAWAATDGAVLLAWLL
jgi:4-hydroxybenzoate polyprenyltransferase